MRLRLLGGLGTVVGVVVLSALVCPPAGLLGDVLRAYTPIRVIHSSGSLWHGSGLIALSDGRRAFLVPGLVAWNVDVPALFLGQLVLSLDHDMVDGAVTVVAGGGTVRVGKGRARVPAALLTLIGPPFNTVRPGGMLDIRWEELRFQGGGFEGILEVRWDNAQSALSRVAPLGSYSLSVTGRGMRGVASLRTLEGPLILQGEGTMREGVIRFSGTADAAPNMRGSLDALIGLLGKRSGDGALLEWEIKI